MGLRSVKIIYTILWLAVVVACCGVDENPFYKNNDHSFYRYRAFFEYHTGHYTSEIPITYGNANGKLAVCSYFNIFGRLHDKRIVVDRSKFDNLSVNWRRALIAHELIHCKLEHLHHTLTPNFEIMNDKLPVHIPISEKYLIDQLKTYKKH